MSGNFLGTIFPFALRQDESEKLCGASKGPGQDGHVNDCPFGSTILGTSQNSCHSTHGIGFDGGRCIVGCPGFVIAGEDGWQSEVLPMEVVEVFTLLDKAFVV